MIATAPAFPHRLPAPGMLWGDYPERDEADRGIVARLDGAWEVLRALAGTRGAAPYLRFARRVAARAAATAPAAADLARLRQDIARRGLDDDTAERAFALACASCRHTLGVMPYATQIAAARVMLDNRLAEMATGEGKTLAVALAAAVAALGGTPVHVVTANDYLAARDAGTLGAFYRALGLSVAAVTQPMARDARRAAYGADVAYCTARELVFDYLRDGLARPRAASALARRARRLGQDERATAPVLRGLCMALIDEADVVLLDEARVPLVLSQPAPALAPDLLAGALACARALRRGRDFTLGEDRLPRLTDDGRALVAAWRPAGAMPSRQREDLVAQALAALHLYSRDRDYVVRDGAVAIVDAASGRIAAGRVWSRGLHQLIELKEGCPPSARNTTAAQITYQRFFRRYLRLGGMSGTLAGAEAELAATYGMAMVRIAPRLPSRRRLQQRTLYADAAALWPAMARRAAALHRAGRPLLIGTATVADSDAAARALAAIGLPHVVLNARHDQAEADVVARAGEPARITVATSMAGRGTDIRLAADAAARGGLHVILCQHNAARRIDRQFIGRTARNGEPGSHDTLLSLDMPLFRRYLPRWWRALAARRRPAPAWFARLTIAVPQWLEERRHRALRRQLLRADLRRERDLDFCRRTAS